MRYAASYYVAPAKKKRKSGPDPFRQGSYHSAPGDLSYMSLRVAQAADTVLAHAEHYDPYTTAQEMGWLKGIRDSAREEHKAWNKRSAQIVQRVQPPGALGRRETAERAEGRMLAREASLRSEASMAREDRRHEGSVAAADAARAHRRGSRHASKEALGALYRNNPVMDVRLMKLVKSKIDLLRADYLRGRLSADDAERWGLALEQVRSADDLTRWKIRYHAFMKARR
jgi:hypothetical protein